MENKNNEIVKIEFNLCNDATLGVHQEISTSFLGEKAKKQIEREIERISNIIAKEIGKKYSDFVKRIATEGYKGIFDEIKEMTSEEEFERILQECEKILHKGEKDVLEKEEK